MKTQASQSKKVISAAIIAAVAVAVTAAISANVFTPFTTGKKVVYVTGELPQLTVDDLAKKAKFIIIGTVASSSAPIVSVDEVHTTTKAYTDVTINVEKDLKSQYTGNQISLRLQGGETDTVKVISENDPTFTAGERVLVFVNDKEPNTVWGDNYYTAGMMLGKYSLVNGKAIGPEYPNGIDEATFITRILQALATTPTTG